jgi:hypothetical protein
MSDVWIIKGGQRKCVSRYVADQSITRLAGWTIEQPQDAPEPAPAIAVKKKKITTNTNEDGI